MSGVSASIRFVPDRSLARQLERDPAYQAALRERADDVAREAQNLGQRANKTYTATVEHGERGPRVVTTALPSPGNANFGGVASWIEWGTVTLNPVAPLRTGVRAAGLRLNETGSAR